MAISFTHPTFEDWLGEQPRLSLSHETMQWLKDAWHFGYLSGFKEGFERGAYEGVT